MTLSTKTTQLLVLPAISTSQPLTATLALQIPNFRRLLVALVRLGDVIALLTSIKALKSATTPDRTTCRDRLTSYNPTTTCSTDSATSPSPWLVRLSPSSNRVNTELPPISPRKSAVTTSPTTRLSWRLRQAPTTRIRSSLRNAEKVFPKSIHQHQPLRPRLLTLLSQSPLPRLKPTPLKQRYLLCRTQHPWISSLFMLKVTSTT